MIGKSMLRKLFQSTHLSRGATRLFQRAEIHLAISIHAPLTRCDLRRILKRSIGDISIHAPLTRCDECIVLGRQRRCISIHAPLTRCDDAAMVRRRLCCHFNPRTSHEVRRCSKTRTFPMHGFQSTHLSRGATGGAGGIVIRNLFQSTHLSRGATLG